jgi:hypothetical protein
VPGRRLIVCRDYNPNALEATPVVLSGSIPNQCCVLIDTARLAQIFAFLRDDGRDPAPVCFKPVVNSRWRIGPDSQGQYLRGLARKRESKIEIT